MWIYLLTCLMAAMPASTGTVVYYAESWNWQQIAANQQVMIPPQTTPIAVADCLNLGRMGYLSLNGETPFPIVVADCTASRDLELIRLRKIIAEVPYPTAQQYRFLGEGKTTGRLWLAPPRTSTRPPSASSPPPGRAENWPSPRE
jgi:hypothetical protein